MKVSVLSIFALAFFMLTGQGFTNEVQAQYARAKHRVERRVERKVERRVHRRVTRRAHLKYAGLPAYRTRVTVLPSGAVRVKVSGTKYFYHSGIYYRHINNAYVVVRPNAGVRIHSLPSKAIRITVRNVRYHYYFGTFYIVKGNEFEVVDAPVGAVVDALPEGYEVTEVNGTELYSLDGVLYQEVDAEEFEDGVGYEVVKM